MSAPPILELQSIGHRLSEVFTLEIAALSIAAGDTLGLLGPTGAGKSTLLRLLTGLDAPTSGTITFQGAPLQPGRTSLSTLRRIAIAHQSPQLLSDTVRANVEYGVRVRGRAVDTQRMSELLESLDLHRLAHQDARTLSGGQRQLVAIGRALAIEPELLLLDEPTSHLDPAHVALVESVIRSRQQQLGTTIVWVTHNLFQARRMATRVGLLLNGRLIEEAPTDTFFESPRDERTAAFIHGKMVY